MPLNIATRRLEFEIASMLSLSRCAVAPLVAWNQNRPPGVPVALRLTSTWISVQRTSHT
jgi:hypothetical protein